MHWLVCVIVCLFLCLCVHYVWMFLPYVHMLLWARANVFMKGVLLRLYRKMQPFAVTWNLSFFLVWTLLPTHGRCRGLLLHLITLSDIHTHTHTHTLGKSPREERLARRRHLYVYSTQYSQEPALHVPGGIRTRTPNKRAAAHPRDFKSVPVKILRGIFDFLTLIT